MPPGLRNGDRLATQGVLTPRLRLSRKRDETTKLLRTIKWLNILGVPTVWRHPVSGLRPELDRLRCRYQQRLKSSGLR